MSQDITPGKPNVLRVESKADLDQPDIVVVNQAPVAPVINEVEQRGN